MKILVTFIIGLVLGLTAGATSVSVFAEKPIPAEYEDGFRDGRTDGYHAAIQQMEGCFK